MSLYPSYAQLGEQSPSQTRGHRFKSHSVRHLIVEIECRLCEIGKKNKTF